MNILTFKQLLKLNENKNIFEANNPKVIESQFEKLLELINKKAGEQFVKVGPLTSIKKSSGDFLSQYYATESGKLIRMNSNTKLPGILHQVEVWYSGGNLETPDYTIEFGEIPITSLISELVNILSSKGAAEKAMNESKVYEARVDKNPLTPAQISQAKSMLDSGATVADVSKALGVPYHKIMKIAKGETSQILPSPQTKQNQMTLEDEVKLIDYIMEDIYDISNKICQNAMRSLFISGRAGVGKTYYVEKAISDNGLIENVDYVYIKGSISPINMYKKLYQFRDKLLVFDDADSVFREEDGRNILKAALDSKKKRTVSYMKLSPALYDAIYAMDNPDWEIQQLEKGLVPNQFDFEGSVIFISNLPKEKADPDGAIRSRSILIDVNPSDMTLLERIRRLLPHLEPKELSMDEKMEIFEFIKESKNISLRTFEKAAMFKVAGLANWKRMAQMYV